MAECKVLKLSSLLELPLLYPHPKLHRPAQSHQQPNSVRILHSHSNLRRVIVICLPQTQISVICQIRSSSSSSNLLVHRQPSLDPHTCWTHHRQQLMSIVVIILVIVMSLAAITTASPCVRQRLPLSTSSQLLKLTSRSIGLMTKF